MSRIFRVILALMAMTVVALQPAVANAQSDCVNATITQQTPQPNSWWPIPGGTYRVLGVWTNQPDSTQVERKLFLYPDQYIEVLGGGTLSSWPAHCAQQALDGYNRINMPSVTTDQLGRIEWLCCDSSVQAKWDAYLNRSASPPATQSAASQTQGCPAARHETLLNPADVEIAGVPAIVRPWWNNGKPPWGQTQTKVMMRPENRTVFVQMMGEYWIYENSAACNARLESELNNTPGLPTKSFDEYRAAGLIR